MDTATIVAQYDWQIGVVKFFKWATGENLTLAGKTPVRYYRQGEGYGFAEISETKYFFHSANHHELTDYSGENDLKPVIDKQTSVIADLSSEDEIVVLEIGPGKKRKPTITKWCFVKQLEEVVEFCTTMPAWRITSSDWCNGKEKPERAKELWRGNNLKALVRFVTQNRSKLLDWSEILSHCKWEYQFHLERLCPDEKWQEPELNDLPEKLHVIYNEDGFGYKRGRPVVYAV